MSRISLGEFEELALLIVAVLHENAYGVSVREEIIAQTNRSINISAVHTVLDRLEKKGLLESYVGGATKTRGGRRKRLFRVTAFGVKSIEQARAMRNTLYDQIPNVVLKLV